MKGYKEIIIPVRKTMHWMSIDKFGARYISTKEPVFDESDGLWYSENDDHAFLGYGPIPKDASKELYRI